MISGRKGGSSEEESPTNPVEMMFKDGVENVTIEMVLSEQEVINACKWGNEKLEKFFTRDKVRQMLKFIVEMPPEGCSKNRGHTMPFVANEIFSCEMASISSKFFTADVVEEKEFEEYKMTPVSSYTRSLDSENGIISNIEVKEQKKPHLEINFNDDCEIVIAEFPEQFLKDSDATNIQTNSEDSIEQYQVNEVEVVDKKDESLETISTVIKEGKDQIATKKANLVKEDEFLNSVSPLLTLQLQNQSKSQNAIDSPDKSLKSPLTKQKPKKNKYELFEDFLSFLDSDGTSTQLNSVLCGYFCNLFKVLVGSHARDVFMYIYQNQQVIERLVNHIYQPAICEIVSRLLNFNQTVFEEDQPQSPKNEIMTEQKAQEIRTNTVFSIMERLGPDFSLEHKIGALGLLKELPNTQNLTHYMTSQRSMQKLKDFLQTEDQEVKSSTFQFLSCLVSRFFPLDSNENEQGKASFRLASIKNPFEEDEGGRSQVKQELSSFPISDDFFEFLTLVVIEVIPFVLRLDQQENVQQFITQYNTPQKRLGMARLHALEFLELVSQKLGARMRIQLKEADIYSLIIDYFEAFPFNDFALQRVFTILAIAIDGRYKKQKPEQEIKVQNLQAYETSAKGNEAIIDDESRLTEDQIIIHLLFQTNLINKIISLPRDKSKMKFSAKNSTEMGYMAYLIELGQMLFLLSEKNDAVQEYLFENPEWEDYVNTILKVKIERRRGTLFDDPRFPKADSEEANFISRLVGNFKITKSPPQKRSTEVNFDEDNVNLVLKKSPNQRSNNNYTEEDNSVTNQEDMDRLIQPYLSFEDDDEEVKEDFEVNEIEKQPVYDMNKYSSNENARHKPLQSLNFQDDEEEQENNSMIKMIELKEQQRTNNSRYGGYSMIKPQPSKRKTSEVLGVTGVDFDSDEEEKKEGRYANKRAQKDDEEDEDDDIERDESLTMDELDGWMQNINKQRRESEEQIIQSQKTDDQDIGPGLQDDHQGSADEDDFDFITEHFKKNQEVKKESDAQDLHNKESFGAVLQRYESDFEQFEVNQELDSLQQTILNNQPAQLNENVAKSNEELTNDLENKAQKFKESEQEKDYFQNSYWKVPLGTEDELFKLLQDYE